MVAPVHVCKRKFSRQWRQRLREGPISVAAWFLLLCLLTVPVHNGDVVHCFGLSSPTNTPPPTLMTSFPAGIHIIQGRRCLLVTPPTPTTSSSSLSPPPAATTTTTTTTEESINDEQSLPLLPPLILLGGMAQTIASWEAHLAELSSSSSNVKNNNNMNGGRYVLVYECLGQGKPPSSLDNINEISDYYSNVTLPRQAELLMNVLNEVFPSSLDFDLVGFSFGARVAMATACLYPHRIHKLHLTGVAVERSMDAHLHITSWQDLLLHDKSLRSFAWSVLLTTYSSTFLLGQKGQSSSTSNNTNTTASGVTVSARTRQRLETWINHISSSNDCDGLLALLQQAEINNVNDPWHVVSMADRLLLANKKTNTKIIGHVCLGALDRMAPPRQAEELCHRLGWNTPTIIPDCGHAVAMEAPRQWSSNVIDFISSSSLSPSSSSALTTTES